MPVWRLSTPVRRPSDACPMPIWCLSDVRLMPVRRLIMTFQHKSNTRTTPFQPTIQHPSHARPTPVWCPSDTCLMPVQCPSDACPTPVWRLSDTCSRPIWSPSDARPSPIRCPPSACQTPVWHPSDVRLTTILCLSDTRLIPIIHPPDTSKINNWYYCTQWCHNSKYSKNTLNFSKNIVFQISKKAPNNFFS